MPIIDNVVADVSHIPRVVTQRVREEIATYEFNGGTSSVLKAAIAKLDQGDVILEEFRLHSEQIQGNALLSAEGKRQQMAAAAKEFFAKLRFVSEAADSRKAAAAELRAQLEKLPKAPGEPGVEAIREQEIRIELRKLALADRMKVLAQSVEHKNLSVLRAIENDPLGASELIPDEFRERLREQLLEQNQAGEVMRWKTLVFVGDKLQLLANVLETVLGQYSLDAPAFAGRPTRTTDLGLRNTQEPAAKKEAVDRKPDHVPAFQ